MIEDDDQPVVAPRPVQLGTDLELRLAGADDVEAMRDVEVDAGRRFRDLPGGLAEIADDDPPAVDVLLANIDNGTAWVVVDRATGAVLGYALASMLDDEAHLDQLSVRESAGRRGIGSALVEAACAWAVSLGFSAITLTTFRDVAFNGPVYARMGFVELAPVDLGPELQLLRDLEQDIGLDVAPRVAMRRRLTGA